MRIVYLNPSGQLGGAELSLLDILASLRETRPEWSLRLIVSADGPLVTRALTLGVATTVLPYPSALARLGDATMDRPTGKSSRRSLAKNLLKGAPPIAGYIRKLRRALKEIDPDVIHTNGFKMHVLAVWSRPRSVPVIWHVRDYVHSRPVMARLLRWHATRCDAIISNSQSVADDVRRVCGEGVKIYPVRNAIDLEKFCRSGATLNLDQLSGLSQAKPNTVRVGLLATMARWKGQEVFLRALSLLPELPEVRGYIIGGPIYQTNNSQYSIDELKQLASDLGISHRVGFTGHLFEPAAAMRSLDVVVHASTQPEPFGRVIAEAMACGRAVIASNAGGAAESFETNLNAVSHKPGDVIELAKRIEELGTKPGLRARLGCAGRAWAEQCFDRSRFATDLGPIYLQVVAGRRGTNGRAQNGEALYLSSDL